LATDIDKIAKFCIQQANIPALVMTDILESIEFKGFSQKVRIFKVKGLKG
jgi:hypothetical protein